MTTAHRAPPGETPPTLLGDALHAEEVDGEAEDGALVELGRDAVVEGQELCEVGQLFHLLVSPPLGRLARLLRPGNTHHNNMRTFYIDQNLYYYFIYKY